MTFPELLVVLSLAAILGAIAGPRMVAFRDRSAMRSARLELAAAVEATRSAALQKGRPARLVARGDSVVVTVQVGPPGGAATGWLTVLTVPSLRRSYGASLALGDPRDSLLAFDARGLAAPRLDRTARLIVTKGGRRDSVCVSRVGLLLPRGCAF